MTNKNDELTSEVIIPGSPDEVSYKPSWLSEEGARWNHFAHHGTLRSFYPKLEPLTYREEIRLFRLFRQGDISARNEIWEHYLRLVLSVVNRFPVPAELLEDVMQEAAIALATAIDRYEVERWNAFSTLAWFWIGQRISRFLDEYANFVRIPVHAAGEYRAFASPFEESLLADCWSDELIALYERDPGKYGAYILVWQMNNYQRLADCRDEVLPAVEIDTESLEQKQSMFNYLKKLSPKERGILLKRFGLGLEDEHTLEQVGAKLGVTRERVRQIENAALEKMRKAAGLLKKERKRRKNVFAPLVSDVGES